MSQIANRPAKQKSAGTVKAKPAAARVKGTRARSSKSYENTSTGAILGGVFGMLGGPLGAIAGAAIGALIGNHQDLNAENSRE